MKTKLPLLLAVLSAAVLLSGCGTITRTVKKTDATLQEIDKLGVTEVEIPGRATHTRYVREEKDGVITSTLTHSNPGLSGPIRIVRQRPAPKSE